MRRQEYAHELALAVVMIASLPVRKYGSSNINNEMSVVHCESKRVPALSSLIRLTLTLNKRSQGQCSASINLSYSIHAKFYRFRFRFFLD